MEYKIGDKVRFSKSFRNEWDISTNNIAVITMESPSGHNYCVVRDTITKLRWAVNIRNLIPIDYQLQFDFMREDSE